MEELGNISERLEELFDVVIYIGENEDILTPSTWHYSTEDPLAICVRFYGAAEPIEWTFARALAEAGLTQPSGAMDVCFEPSKNSDDEVLMRITSPHGTATLGVPRAELTDFLQKSYRLVPAGQETTLVQAKLERELQNIEG